jgi:hypothetical protein
MNHANTASASALNTEAKETEASCLLLHGSFHGGWCWEKMAPYLPSQLKVYAPSLALTPASTGLNDHIAQAASAIAALPAHKPYIAVAHSYAGMALPAAIAQAGRRPQLSLFLDAFVPRKGESAFDLLGPGADAMRSTARDGFLPAPPAAAFGVEGEAFLAWCDDNLKPMPLKTHDDPAPIGANDLSLGAAVFCRCTGFSGFQPMETRAERMGWALHFLNTGHDAMITAPQELAQLIGDLYEATKP